MFGETKPGTYTLDFDDQVLGFTIKVRTKHCALVTAVRPGGPASAQGVAPGDVLTEIGGAAPRMWLEGVADQLKGGRRPVTVGFARFSEGNFGVGRVMGEEPRGLGEGFDEMEVEGRGEGKRKGSGGREVGSRGRGNDKGKQAGASVCRKGVGVVRVVKKKKGNVKGKAASGKNMKRGRKVREEELYGVD